MNNYFTSKAMELSFYLLEMDGQQRMKKLNITRFLFSSKTASEKWYNNILEILQQEENEITEKAIIKLNQLYAEM